MISDRYFVVMRILHNLTYALGVCSIRTNTTTKRNYTNNHLKYMRKLYLHVFLCLCWLLEFVVRLRISLQQRNISSFNIGGAFFIMVTAGTTFICLEVFFADQICRVANGVFSLCQHIQGKHPGLKHLMLAVLNRKLLTNKLIWCNFFQKSI